MKASPFVQWTNAAALVLFLVASLLGAGFCHADDRIVNVDPGAKLLTVEQSGALKLYRLAETGEVTLNGAKATFAELVPCQNVTVKAVGALNAVKIAASGIGHTPASPSPLTLRSVTVQIRVDGNDRVLYQDGKLWIEHLSGQNPTAITINGIEWSPAWNGDKADAFTKFTVPVAPIGQARVTLKQVTGRGKVKLEHSTVAPAVVTIEDAPGGAADYEFQFSW